MELEIFTEANFRNEFISKWRKYKPRNVAVDVIVVCLFFHHLRRGSFI